MIPSGGGSNVPLAKSIVTARHGSFAARMDLVLVEGISQRDWMGLARARDANTTTNFILGISREFVLRVWRASQWEGKLGQILVSIY